MFWSFRQPARRGTSDEHEDVVDVDLDLLDELDLEDDVLVDRLLVAVAVLRNSREQVEVDVAVVLVLPGGEQLVAGKPSKDVRMFVRRRIAPNRPMNSFCAASPMIGLPRETPRAAC